MTKNNPPSPEWVNEKILQPLDFTSKDPLPKTIENFTNKLRILMIDSQAPETEVFEAQCSVRSRRQVTQKFMDIITILKPRKNKKKTP